MDRLEIDSTIELLKIIRNQYKYEGAKYICLSKLIVTLTNMKKGTIFELPEFPVKVGSNLGRSKIIGADANDNTITIKILD